ncbi:MAG TPA: hypothetical protein VLF61_02630 [Rhabdochlamydiaceae bacterium]|nr:hypothetical protein [Rhabdochlamydiaceae bacterium]
MVSKIKFSDDDEKHLDPFRSSSKKLRTEVVSDEPEKQIPFIKSLPLELKKIVVDYLPFEPGMSAIYAETFNSYIFPHSDLDVSTWKTEHISKLIEWMGENPNVKSIQGTFSYTQLISVLWKCRTVEKITLVNCCRSDHSRYIKICNLFPVTVKELTLSLCSIDTLSLAQYLSKSVQLESLTITYTEFDGNCLKSVSRNVIKLNLPHAKQIMPDTLSENLQEFRQLQCLDISNTLANTTTLNHLPITLTFLDISGCTMTDCTALEKLKNLQFLKALESSLTPEQIENLQKKMPHLHIEYSQLPATQPVDWGDLP